MLADSLFAVVVGKQAQDPPETLATLSLQDSTLDLPYTARNKPLRRYDWHGIQDSAYTSLDQLTIWRAHFWNDPKPGDQSCWDSLFAVCTALLADQSDGALVRAQWALDQSELKVPSG